jgi:hypothetical protein
MKLQNLRVVTRASLLPGAAIVLAAGIFVADTIADLDAHDRRWCHLRSKQ